MVWFILSVLTAFLSASEAAWLKKFFSEYRHMEMTAMPFLYALPLLLAVQLFVETPTLEPGFWPLFWLVTPLTGLGIILHLRAIQISPLSLTMPYLAFTPVFALFTGIFFLSELPALSGCLGMGAIVLGGYILNMESGNKSWKAPLMGLVREKGSQLMFGAAFIYGFCSVLGKKLVVMSAPLYLASLLFIWVSLGILLLGLLTRSINLRRMFSNPGKGLIVGCLFFLDVTCHNIAINMVTAAYMISIKRLNVLFSVFYGKLLFNEKNLKFRLAGATLMSIGAIAIAVYG